MQAASAMAVVKKVLLGRRKVRGVSFPSLHVGKKKKKLHIRVISLFCACLEIREFEHAHKHYLTPR